MSGILFYPGGRPEGAGAEPPGRLGTEREHLKSYNATVGAENRIEIGLISYF
jgi:hypothetical protein